jgi:hypothetical protein
MAANAVLAEIPPTTLSSIIQGICFRAKWPELTQSEFAALSQIDCDLTPPSYAFSDLSKRLVAVGFMLALWITGYFIIFSAQRFFGRWRIVRYRTKGNLDSITSDLLMFFTIVCVIEFFALLFDKVLFHPFDRSVVLGFANLFF